MELEAIVIKALNRFHIVFGLISLVLAYFVGSEYGFIGLASLAPVLFLSYHFGTFIIGFTLARVLDAEFIHSSLRDRKISAINDKLQSGEIQQGAELDAAMIDAGMRPMSTIVEYGAVIGVLGDTTLYEHIDATEGTGGELRRFVYAGQAEFDKHDGSVLTASSINHYIVLNGILYEHVVPDSIS